MGHFADRRAAEKYAEYRPYFHPVVMERISAVCGPLARTSRALDVACGTGQSAIALKSLVDNVVATDIALEMLQQGPSVDGMSFVQAEAECLPVASSTIDLLTVSLAFHWFNREAFLAEAERVLRPNAYLVIYNNFFYGPRDETPAFAKWQASSYHHRFAAPALRFSPPTLKEAQRYGFALISSETYANLATFTPERLTHYLMTQSNVLIAMNTNKATSDEIYRNVLDEVQLFFTAPEMDFRFGGPIWFLQKIA